MFIDFFDKVDIVDKTGTSLVKDKVKPETEPCYFSSFYFYLLGNSESWISKNAFTLRQIMFFCEEKGYNFSTTEIGYSANPIKGSNNVAVSSVTLSASSLTPTEGDAGTLTPTINPSNATDKSVTFSSSASTIVSIDNAGKWNALKAGSATVTVKTSNNKTATCSFNVAQKVIAVTGVTVDKPTLSVKVNDTGKITATVAPSTATNKAVTWTSDKPTIVSVDASGNFTAKAEGVAVITVKTTDGNKVATSTITVTAPEPA